jgi:hypothetical protein
MPAAAYHCGHGTCRARHARHTPPPLTRLACPAHLQVPKTAGKKKKGKKLEASLLGFASGTNYDLLEKPA